MKVTKAQLKQIIKEELEGLLDEDDFSDYQATAGGEADWESPSERVPTLEEVPSGRRQRRSRAEAGRRPPENRGGQESSRQWREHLLHLRNSTTYENQKRSPLPRNQQGHKNDVA